MRFIISKVLFIEYFVDILMPDSIIYPLFALYPAHLGRIDRAFTEIHGGRSGAQVLLVDVIGSGAPEAYTGKAYAKIDSRDRTELEYEKHAVARKGQENSIPDVLCEPLHGDKGYSLLLYRPANGAVVGARSLVQVLEEYLKNRHTRDSLTLQIEQLVSQALSPWQAVPSLIDEREEQHPLELVRDLINRGGEDRFSNMEERFQVHFGLSKNPQLLTFVAETHAPLNAIILPNPLHYALTPSNFPKLKLARTPMHGDLHTGNIICRLDVNGRLAAQMPQMLDLALFEPQGMMFFDLAYLELDILCQCLPVEDDDDWVDWLAVLHHLNISDVMPQSNPPGIRPAAAWELVQPIRRQAETLIQQISSRATTVGEDYRACWWLAGWAAGLVMARRRRLHSKPWRQSAALLSSAWSLAHLLKFWNIRFGGTPQTLEWQGEAGLQTTLASPLPLSGQRVGKLKNVPALPAYKLERQEDLRNIRDLVLESASTPGTAGRVAVQGMGGLGKTVVAASVCRDSDVQKAFPDGIYWLTFGMQPQVTNLQALLAQWIEGRPTTLSDLESLRYLLMRLLNEKRCLLVLDDVWDENHLQGFRSLGDSVCLLVTTRKHSVVHALEAVSYTLPTLDDQQARKLLADASGHNPVKLPKGADIILHECGGLPLALAMVGSALKGKPGDRWDDIGTELQTARIDEVKTPAIEASRYNNLWGAIHISVAELGSKTQECYLDFAVFPDDVAIPEKTLMTFWHLRGMDAREVRKTIEKLFEAALLMRDRGSVKLHDLQMDYVRLRVEKEQGDVSALHARLLNAYNPGRQPWYKIKHDGYLYHRLAFHLKALGQLGELHELVTGSPDWRDIKFEACEGDASYADDVLTLLGQYHDPLSPDDVICVAQLRAAQQVIRNRTSRYTDINLKTLAWLGRLGEAFSYARLRPQPEKRFEGLQAIREALVAKSDAENPTDSAALQQVTRALLEDLPSVVQLEECECWKDLLKALVREGRVEEARDAVYAIESHETRALALRILAATLFEKDPVRASLLFDEAMKATLLVIPPEKRTRVLNAIEAARAHPRTSRSDDAPANVEQTSEWVDNFKDLRHRLTGESRERIDQDAFAETLRIIAMVFIQSGPQNGQSGRGLEKYDDTLSRITMAQMKEKAYGDAEFTALHIHNVDDRAWILSHIAAALAFDGHPDGERVFRQAEENARTIDNTDRRARALDTLVDALAQAHAYKHAEQIACRIQDEHIPRRVSALSTVALALVDVRAYSHAERVIYRIEDPHKRIPLLIKLGSALSQIKHPDAARVFANAEGFARRIDYLDKRVMALSTLGVALAQAQRPESARIFAEAEALTHQIDYLDRRISALSALGLALSQTQSPDVLRIFAETEALADKIETDKRASALQELAIALADARMYDRAEKVINKIESPEKRASTLRHLATPMIDARLYDRVEQIAGQIEQPEMRGPILRDLAVALVPTQLLRARKLFEQAEALADAVSSEQVDKQVGALRDLALAMAQVGLGRADQLFTRAERIASKIKEIDEREYCLHELGVALAKAKLYTRAEQTILGIKNELRIQSLGELATMLAQADQFEAAFSMVETQDMPEYLWWLGTWCEALERLEEGLFLRVLRATLSIFSWEQDRWREIDEVLALRFPQGLALVIGLDSSQNLDSVEARDARAMARFLRYEAGYGQVRLLTNHQATRENIHQGLKWLANQAAITADAIAVVYFSGHSVKLADEQVALLGYETPEANHAMTLSDFDEWVGNVRAKQTIIFLDCGHASAATSLKPVIPDVSALSASRGRAFMASCATGQQSVIAPGQHHSLFAEVLLKQLRAEGDVELLLLWQKLQTEIKYRAAELGHEQTPRVNTVDYDRVVIVSNATDSDTPAGV